MSDTVHVQGLAELAANFKRIPLDVGRKVLRSGVSAGAKVVKLRIIANTPVRSGGAKNRGGSRTQPGLLKRSVIVNYRRRDSNDTQAVFVVLIREGKRFAQKGRDAFYGKFVERGHRVVARRAKNARKGTLARNRRASTRRVDAHPFFVPSFAASADSAIQAIKNTIAAGLTKVIG